MSWSNIVKLCMLYMYDHTLLDRVCRAFRQCLTSYRTQPVSVFSNTQRVTFLTSSLEPLNGFASNCVWGFLSHFPQFCDNRGHFLPPGVAYTTVRGAIGGRNCNRGATCIFIELLVSLCSFWSFLKNLL